MFLKKGNGAKFMFMSTGEKIKSKMVAEI